MIIAGYNVDFDVVEVPLPLRQGLKPSYTPAMFVLGPVS